jgi:hypothetical protein
VAPNRETRHALGNAAGPNDGSILRGNDAPSVAQAGRTKQIKSRADRRHRATAEGRP